MAMKLSPGAIVLSVCLGLAFFAGQPVTAHRGGRHGGHDKKDPKDPVDKKDPKEVVDKVNEIVATAIKDNPGIGPALVRLFFHDCWVNGCDGSVLLDSSDTYGSNTEKKAKNNVGLDGFAVIDDIKKEVGEDLSCADIVVLAARDATFILSRGKINYAVETGRTDGNVSSADAADSVLPPSTFNVTQLKANFLDKGFTTTELVALSGAHAVGVAHRSSFEDRLHSATATPISPKYQEELLNDVGNKTNSAVPNPTEPNNIRDMNQDFQTKSEYNATGVDTSATGVLDNSYYHANLQNRVLFRSDWELRNDTTRVAGKNMATFRDDANEWYLQFGNAMTKLSKLLGQNPGSVNRTNCREINPN